MHIGQVIQKPTTYCIQKADNSQHVPSRRHYALHSYASIPRNTRCSRSVLPITVSTLVFYVTFLSLIIFKIIPHPMTLLIAFPLKVILPYLILYYLLPLAYCHILICCPVVISRALAVMLHIILTSEPLITRQSSL
jgi:hypothetical protein